MKTVLDFALNYSSRGWRVIPLHSVENGFCSCSKPGCTSPGKHPMTSHGVHDGTTDPNLIRQWFQKWPNANLGIVTGASSKILVIDIDDRNGGEDALSKLEALHGHLPPTVESLTGNGRHIYLNFPQHDLSCSIGKLGAGLDVKANGGYVVAPPSRHVNGRTYQWEASCHPNEVLIADSPNWLMKLLTETTATPRRSSEYWRQIVDSCFNEGERNVTLTSLTGMLLRKRIDPYVVLTLMRSWNRCHMQPPMSDQEVYGIVKSIVRRENLRRKGAPSC